MSQAKKEARRRFNEECLKRDRGQCRGCGVDAKNAILNVHHITDRNEMPNGGYVKENGITLCDQDRPDGRGGTRMSCHYKAERYHVTEGMEAEKNFHPRELYMLIKSSFDEAYEASLALGNDDMASRKVGRIRVQYSKAKPMIAYLYFRREKGDASHKCVEKNGAVIDYGRGGNPIGIEILNPSMSTKTLNALLAECSAEPLSEEEARVLTAPLKLSKPI